MLKLLKPLKSFEIAELWGVGKGGSSVAGVTQPTCEPLLVGTSPWDGIRTLPKEVGTWPIFEEVGTSAEVGTSPGRDVSCQSRGRDVAR